MSDPVRTDQDEQDSLSVHPDPGSAPVEVLERNTDEDTPLGDVDTNGHLATGLFVGVIGVLLVVIYAFAMAA